MGTHNEPAKRRCGAAERDAYLERRDAMRDSIIALGRAVQTSRHELIVVNPYVVAEILMMGIGREVTETTQEYLGRNLMMLKGLSDLDRDRLIRAMEESQPRRAPKGGDQQ